MNTAKFLNKVEGLATLERPRYSPGLLLEDEDLTAGVDYTREITRLLFRSLFGCGVICGLDVKAILKCKRNELHVEVGPGVGLDGSGNPLHVPKTQQVAYDPDCEPMPPVVWVVLCYKDRNCRPKDVSCSGDGDSRSEHTRSRDGFVIKLYDGLPDCACTCAKPGPGKPGRRLGRCCHDEDEEEYEAAVRRAEAVRDAGMAERERALAERERSLEVRAALLGGHRPAGLEGIVPVHEHAPLVTPSGAVAPIPEMSRPAAPAAERPRSKRPEICECYEEHNAGKCVPDCGCSCVVLARIDTTPPKDDKEDDVEVAADNNVRRRIRPVLTGYLECLEAPKDKEPGPTPEPLSVTCRFASTRVQSLGEVGVTAIPSNAVGAVDYNWTADRGRIVPTAPDAATATYTAPRITRQEEGQATVTVRAKDSRGVVAESTCTVNVVFRLEP